MATVSIADLVKKSADFVLRGKEVELLFDIQNDLWLARVDPGQITQVVQNLVINAAQAMEGSGGTITLRCRNIDRFPGGKTNDNPHRHFIEVAVCDQGNGLSEDSQKYIFDPYFTTKKEGSGLGLAISYSIIKKHNGVLTVESKEGEGSTFTFFIPASPEAVEEGTRETQPLEIRQYASTDMRTDLDELATLRQRLATQTYYTAKAEFSFDTLHTIRNVLTPIFLCIQKLKENMNDIDLSYCQQAKNEFSSPDLDNERKEKLTQYILLSIEQFNGQLQEINKTANDLSFNINRIHKIIGQQDEILNYVIDKNQVHIESLFKAALGLFDTTFYENIDIQIAPDISKIRIEMDRRLVLIQVSHKIIKNAVESIKMNNTEHGQILIFAESEKAETKEVVHVQIRDNGAGIPTEDIDKIFDREFSTKDEPGRGKSLHLCAMWINSLGGKIFAESAGPGQGANLHIILPTTG